MIELGLHTDNWRTLSGSFETACDAAVKYGLGHIEFAVIHGQYFITAMGYDPSVSLQSNPRALRRYLDGIESAVLHGRTSAIEREEIMRRFRQGEVRVLVATTVIEVGVDNPNATVMVIESGERFGLSQLHQLRGRVGRGRDQSRCVVIHGDLSQEANQRLQVFGETSDGFKIAEADLEIRGPGDLLGTRQAGLPVFRAADIIRDRLWLEAARVDAQELISGSSAQSSEPFLEQVRERARSRYESFAGG